MSAESIAFLVCAIICTMGLVGAILGYWWRHIHPYTTSDLERSNWFTRWIRSNINLFMWLIMIIALVCAIIFFTMFGTSLRK